MSRTGKGWRAIGGLLAVLVLAVLTFGSSLDAYVCRGEGVLTVAAADAAAGAHSAQAPAADHHSDSDDACVHGHCHHGSAFVSAQPATYGALARSAHRLIPGRAPVVLSDLQFGLMRPPRA